MAEIRKVGLITIQENRVLLCRKRKRKTRLILPGGKREPGESSLETLRRELLEELGDVKLEDPQLLGTYVDKTDGMPGFWPKTIEIELYLGRLRGEPRPKSEIAALVWFGPDDSWETLAPSLSRSIFPDLIERGILAWKSAPADHIGEEP